MILYQLKLSIITSLLLMTATCLAQEQTIICPTFIKSAAIQNISVTPSDGFLVSWQTNEQYRVRGIGLYDGHPDLLMQLKPYNDDDNPATWLELELYQDNLFVSCNYAGGLIQLNKAINDVKICTAHEMEETFKLVCN